MKGLYPLVILFIFLNVSLSEAQPYKSAKSYLDRGNGRVLKGDLEGAIDDFGIAIKFEPGYTEAYYERGRALLAKGDLDSARSRTSAGPLRLIPASYWHTMLAPTLY